PSAARESLAAFEQTLYQGKVPFTLVPGRYPGDLSRFRVLVLADVALISDGLVGAVRDYVMQGGRLVLTGQAGVYDESHHRRKARGLADRFPEPLADRVSPATGSLQPGGDRMSLQKAQSGGYLSITMASSLMISIPSRPKWTRRSISASSSLRPSTCQSRHSVGFWWCRLTSKMTSSSAPAW